MQCIRCERKRIPNASMNVFDEYTSLGKQTMDRGCRRHNIIYTRVVCNVRLPGSCIIYYMRIYRCLGAIV